MVISISVRRRRLSILQTDVLNKLGLYNILDLLLGPKSSVLFTLPNALKV